MRAAVVRLLVVGAAVVGVLLAQPFVSLVTRYAARFSIRALEVTVDSSVLWVGAGLAIIAAILLAYVPRLPSPYGSAGLGLTSGGVRITIPNSASASSSPSWRRPKASAVPSVPPSRPPPPPC